MRINGDFLTSCSILKEYNVHLQASAVDILNYTMIDLLQSCFVVFHIVYGHSV